MGLVGLVIQDGGRIKEWPMSKLMGTDMNTQLFDKNENYIHIEGPILNAARLGGFVSQEDPQTQEAHRAEIRDIFQQLNAPQPKQTQNNPESCLIS